MEKNLYSEAQVEEFLQEHADKLTEREKDIVRLRFGLLDGKLCSVSEVAMIMDVTPERVRYLESRIFRKCGAGRAMRRKKFRSSTNREDVDMTELECQEVLDRVKAIAGTCYSMVTAEEIKDVINKVNPHISVFQMESLIQDCKQYVQIVTPEEKQKMLQSTHPEEYIEHKPDLSLIDRFFCIFVQREIDPEVKICWKKAVDTNDRLRTILQNRRNSAPELLAEALEISLEDLYYLEREIIKLYYACSDKVREDKT